MKTEDYSNMRKTNSAGKRLSLVILMAFLMVAVAAVDLPAMNRQVAENPLYGAGRLAKAAAAPGDTFVCDVGTIENRISNSTYEKQTGTNDWTIIIGDDALELSSMQWKTPTQYVAGGHTNHYLYYSSLRLGYDNKLVHLAPDRATAIETKSNIDDPTAISLYDTHFYIDDQSALVPDALKIGVRVHENTYAWSESYRDDFIIYDFWIVNLNQQDSLAPFYVGLHADCDLSTAEGGESAQAYSRDDKVGYYGDEAAGEYISYMYDADNPTVPGNDSAGNKTPKEAAGFLGSRLLYCPPVVGQTVPTRQTGHAWWDWNSDPSGDQEWFTRMTDTSFLPPPPSPHDYRFFQKLGPFSISPMDSIRVVFAFGMGAGLEALRANLGWADTLFRYDWVGPAAPPSPSFTLTPGDRQVTIEWVATPEIVDDPLSHEVDFEGYRLWRKTQTGNWALLMDCDKVDSIGPNTGLVHSYVDYDVMNNFQYTYTITSYDKGDPIHGIEALESGKGVGQMVAPGMYSMSTDADNTGIHAVPNPFVMRSAPDYGFQPNVDDPSTDRITFINLPEDATVKIYTLTGDLLTTIKTDRNPRLGWQRVASWNLITDKTQAIVSGLYLFVVSAPDFDDFIGKFAVVR